MTKEQRCACGRIFAHYGVRSQLVKLKEELGELDMAADIALCPEDAVNITGNLLEEMADVGIMLTQLVDGLGVRRQVGGLVGFKLDRQLKRIAAEERRHGGQ